MTSRLILTNGTVWTSDGILENADVVVNGPHIEAVGPGEGDSMLGDRLDMQGLLVLPGLIDTHSHHREPGFTHKEDILHATKAAAAGGVTTTIGMPNVEPIVNSLETYNATLDLYRHRSLVNFNIHPAPIIADEVQHLAEAGALAFKVFQVVDSKRTYPHMPGLGVTDDADLLEIFEVVRETGLPLMVHPHNQALMELFEQRSWAEGRYGPTDYARAQRMYGGLLWNTAISNLILMQEAVGTRLHILHLVTSEAVDMVQSAKRAGRAVTSEVNAFALFLGGLELIEREGPRVLGRWVPEDVKRSLWEGIVNGVVDVLGTDHGPHTLEEKARGWSNMWEAPTAAPQLQDYLSKLLDVGLRAGMLDLDRAVRLISYNPARIFGLWPEKGDVRPGSDADLVIVDPSREVHFRDENALSKCGWTPYHGDRAVGAPIHTMVRGRFVFRDQVVVGEPGWGRQASPSSQAANSGIQS